MWLKIHCIRGVSASRPVILGFASSSELHSASFADVLDEATGRGYQRRFNAQHSMDFRRYIQKAGSATIPLTFNARPDRADAWEVVEGEGGAVSLHLSPSRRPLAQVDCQHRLGFLSDAAVQLPFMCFLGLSDREELEIFGVINGKAKGLSRSLLDFHDAQLCSDLAAERPELLVALVLKNDPLSPWYQRLDLGGEGITGMERRASLRTMQKASKQFLNRIKGAHALDPEEAARILRDFWLSVSTLMPLAFAKPRSYLVTKGIGVYALMEVAAEILLEAPFGALIDVAYFNSVLGDFLVEFDWSTSGPLKGLGGEGGVAQALVIIREARRRARLRVANG